MKVQLGKEYLTRGGAHYGPMVENDQPTTMRNWPFKCPRTKRSFKENGQYGTKPGPDDLIFEVGKDNPTLEPRVPQATQTIVEAALNGSRGDAQQRLAKRGMQLTELLLQKNRDHGESAWKIPVLSPHMTAREAIQCRMSDKVARLQRLLAGNEAEVADENVEATMVDLVGYGILWLEAPAE